MDLFAKQLELADSHTNRGWQVRVALLQKYFFEGWERTLGLLLGAVGVLVAIGGIRVFIALSEWFSPEEIVPIDGRVLGFTLAISLSAGILFSLAPSLLASKLNLNESLKEEVGRVTGDTHCFTRNLLVISEVALALVLLSGAGLMMKSLLHLSAINPGFNPRKLLTAEIELADKRYREILENDRKKVTPLADDFFQQILERLQTVPGVESVGMSGVMRRPCPFRIVGQPEPPPDQRPSAGYREVNADYFRTMQIPILKSRSLTEQDDERSSWVVVINETMARLYFPRQDPIGKLLSVKFEDASGIGVEEDRPREIVGIVGDVRHGGLILRPEAAMYVPHRQHIWVYAGGGARHHLWRNIFIRTNSDPISLAGSLRQVVAQVDKQQAVYDIMTMEQRLSQELSFYRFHVQLFGIFSGMAVFMAVLGIYGVMSYSAKRRTHEIGVRMTLGATTGTILKLVVGTGLKLTLIGIALGVAAALLLTRLMAHLLFEVKPFDAATFTIISVALIGVGLMASYLPARRATKVDPMLALRYE